MKTIEELEIYAKDNYIPIARKELVSFLKEIILKNGYHSILEIGAAIGYTSIQLALLDDVYVTTFEYWPPRYSICKENIKDFGLEDKIFLSDKDFMEADFEGNFDLIFIDGAKAKTIQNFEFLKDRINKNGTIIVDNIDLEIVNQIELVNKKKKYQKIVEETKEYFKEIDGYNVTYMAIGDGIYFITKK